MFKKRICIIRIRVERKKIFVKHYTKQKKYDKIKLYEKIKKGGISHVRTQ